MGGWPLTMTKRELATQIAVKLGMTQKDVASVLETFLDEICRRLADGRRLELRDFGVFDTRTRTSHVGRNPRTGEQVAVPERKVVTFRPGKRMKEVIANPPPATNPQVP